jgi:hypothetical protein
MDLFELFWWLKMYPSWRSMAVVFGCGKSAIEGRIHRRLMALASEMDDVIQSFWDQRHAVSNPCQGFFDGNIIGYVDTFPIRIYQPSNSAHRKAAYQPKYKGPVLKIQVIVGHTGLPIFISGPHLGVRSDIRIWRKFGPERRGMLEHDERVFGDKAYIDQNQGHLIVPFKEYKDHPLTQDQLDFNAMHRCVMCHVSYVMSCVMCHVR